MSVRADNVNPVPIVNRLLIGFTNWFGHRSNRNNCRQARIVALNADAWKAPNMGRVDPYQGGGRLLEIRLGRALGLEPRTCGFGDRRSTS